MANSEIRAAVEQPQRRLGAQPFRRHVEQVKLTGDELGLDQAALVEVLGGVEEPGPDAEVPQRVHLVLHERDERRDDHSGPLPHQRGNLVAQGLAAAGRHQHQGVVAADEVVDDLPLAVPEGVIAENAAQYLGWLGHAGAGAGGGHLRYFTRIPGRRRAASPARQVHHKSPPVST